MNYAHQKLLQRLGSMFLLIILVTSCTNKPDTLTTDSTLTIDALPSTTSTESPPPLISEGYGAKGADLQTEFTLEEMMKYALEDEYLAYAEYALILSEMDVTRPFSNIIKAEATHIKYMEDLYETYGFELPSVDPSQHILLPDSTNEAFIAGVDAEVINIAMYEKFLEQDLPDDVREVFERLKAGSESHLKAFQKNVR